MFKFISVALAIVPSLLALPIRSHVPSIESQTGADALRDVLKLVASPTMKAYPAASLKNENLLPTERDDEPWEISTSHWPQIRLQSSAVESGDLKDIELK